MREAERLIEAFRARATSLVRSKLDALLDLEGLREPRVVPFLLEVLADRREPTQARIRVLKLRLEARPVPEPGRGQVRVRVQAAPVNPNDMHILRGRYGLAPPLPAVLGQEAVGVVDAVGAAIARTVGLGASGAVRILEGQPMRPEQFVEALRLAEAPARGGKPLLQFGDRG